MVHLLKNKAKRVRITKARKTYPVLPTEKRSSLSLVIGVKKQCSKEVIFK